MPDPALVLLAPQPLYIEGIPKLQIVLTVSVKRLSSVASATSQPRLRSFAMISLEMALEGPNIFNLRSLLTRYPVMHSSGRSVSYKYSVCREVHNLRTSPIPTGVTLRQPDMSRLSRLSPQSVPIIFKSWSTTFWYPRCSAFNPGVIFIVGEGSQSARSQGTHSIIQERERLQNTSQLARATQLSGSASPSRTIIPHPPALLIVAMKSWPVALEWGK